MVIINGHKLYEVPSSCGTCPFLLTGNTDCPDVGSGYSKGICLQWDETHHTWAHIPRRCEKLFKQAFALYDDSGMDLVITKK